LKYYVTEEYNYVTEEYNYVTEEYNYGILTIEILCNWRI